MPDLSEFEPVRFGERSYIPLLVLDGQMRRCEFRVPDASLPPRYSRAVQPYACQECADLTIDPVAHNVLHDGPACRICGCTETNACIVDNPEVGLPVPCWWVEPDLCSNPACVAAAAAAREPIAQTVDLVAALRQSIEEAKQRREAGERP